MVVAGRKYFAFSKYVVNGDIVTSYCGETEVGWTNNVVGRNWGCYRWDLCHFTSLYDENFNCHCYPCIQHLIKPLTPPPYSARKTTPVAPRNHTLPSYLGVPPLEVRYQAQNHFRSSHALLGASADNAVSLSRSHEDLLR